MPSTDSLDYAFLQYIGVSAEGEAALHRFYLPLLAGSRRVLDLGCGFGGFVQLLRSTGHDATGVDSDPQCIAEAQRHDLPVIEADVLGYLRQSDPGSWDAIVAAHLVEHLPYEAVNELVQLAYRALAPSGKLLLITPNPRALVSHMELYPLHFAHVAMYHPRLLTFFMQQAGFQETESGENPSTITTNVSGDSPLRTLREVGEHSRRLSDHTKAVEDVLPRPSHPLRRLLWSVKMVAIRWLIRPYYDHTMAEVQQLSNLLSTTVAAIDRPFEAYALGKKPVHAGQLSEQTGMNDNRSSEQTGVNRSRSFEQTGVNNKADL